MQVSAMLLTAALTMFGTQNMSAASEDSSPGLPCMVVAIYESDVPADLPAQQGGVLRSINVKVGDQVKPGDVLATVDDEQEKLSLAAAEERLAMAREEAGNDVNVKYAKAAAKVYQYKYETVKDAIDKVPDSFSKSDVVTYLLQWEQYYLQTEQAIHEQNLAKMSVRVREAENKLAQHDLERRQIKAPVEGVIEEVKVFEGNWVRAGEPVVRLIQMDRLKINAAFAYGPLTPADVRGKEALVTVNLARGQIERFKGVVNSTSSIYNSGGKIHITIEVFNRRDEATGDWLLMPGMDGTIQIPGVDLTSSPDLR
jgi:macrolide-specific efflux system membrane fusion protein